MALPLTCMAFPVTCMALPVTCMALPVTCIALSHFYTMFLRVRGVLLCE